MEAGVAKAGADDPVPAHAVVTISPRHCYTIALAALLLGGCEAPFGLDRPTTRSLEQGATASLSQARSFEMKGSYEESSVTWTLDLQLRRPAARHLLLDGGGVRLEALLIGTDTYFRGRDFLAAHVATSARSQQLLQAAGDSWWKGLPGVVPQLPDFTEGTAFAAAFLGSALDRRVDGVTAGGEPAVELSGPRADVYVEAAAPHRPLRIRLRPGVEVDGLSAADFTYGAFDRVPPISAPAGVIDFSDANTLPPLYKVVSVDTSRCEDPCIVSATVQNLGGLQHAAGPSIVTFTATGATGETLGTCEVKVIPDVPFSQTATVGCTIPKLGSVDFNAARVTAAPINPGRG